MSERGLTGRVVNILYYLSVLLICFHYGAEDEALDRFMERLREILERYARKVHGK